MSADILCRPAVCLSDVTNTVEIRSGEKGERKRERSDFVLIMIDHPNRKLALTQREIFAHFLRSRPTCVIVAFCGKIDVGEVGREPGTTAWNHEITDVDLKKERKKKSISLHCFIITYSRLERSNL